MKLVGFTHFRFLSSSKQSIVHFNNFRLGFLSIGKLSRNDHRTKMTASTDLIEKCKECAARRVVDDNIDSDCIVGIGSGSTMTYVLSRIAEICEKKRLSIKCIPTSLQSKQLIYDFKLPITEIDCHPEIDITIDGADEVDENLVAIKGGGACLAQEKVVASAAKKFVVVADYRKDSKSLGDSWKKGIPIEVLPMACNLVRHQISKIFKVPLSDLVLRIGKEKAGPVITDNGNLVIDWKYNYPSNVATTSAEWKSIANRVKLIPGVVESGIFVDMIDEAYFGQPDGTVIKRLPK